MRRRLLLEKTPAKTLVMFIPSFRILRHLPRTCNLYGQIATRQLSDWLRSSYTVYIATIHQVCLRFIFRSVFTWYLHCARAVKTGTGVGSFFILGSWSGRVTLSLWYRSSWFSVGSYRFVFPFRVEVGFGSSHVHPKLYRAPAIYTEKSPVAIERLRSYTVHSYSTGLCAFHVQESGVSSNLIFILCLCRRTSIYMFYIPHFIKTRRWAGPDRPISSSVVLLELYVLYFRFKQIENILHLLWILQQASVREHCFIGLNFCTITFVFSYLHEVGRVAYCGYKHITGVP